MTSDLLTGLFVGFLIGAVIIIAIFGDRVNRILAELETAIKPRTNNKNETADKINGNGKMEGTLERVNILHKDGYIKNCYESDSGSKDDVIHLIININLKNANM